MASFVTKKNDPFKVMIYFILAVYRGVSRSQQLFYSELRSHGQLYST